MRMMMPTAAIAVTLVAAPLSARQLPTMPPGMGQAPIEKPEILDPNPRKDHGCVRTNEAATAAKMKNALDNARKTGGTPEEVEEVQTSVAGCTYYRITLKSTMTIEDTEVPGVTSTISGEGSISFGLTPDDAQTGYDFTTGEQDLSAPIYWDKGSALITRPDCIVTTVELPYTLFDFWLGVTSGPNQKIGVKIAPAGNELHNIATRCKDPLGKWHDLYPAKEAIFSPAWIRLHGEGKLKAPQSADQKALTQYTNDLGKGKTPAPPKVSNPTGDVLDMGKLMALANDPKKLADLEKLDPDNPADMAKLNQLMNGVVPGAQGQLKAAQDNFMFTAPGECTAVKNARDRWQCIPAKSGIAVTMPDRLGYGTIKKLTESTVITVTKLPPRP
jgi:hypothetical protein